MNIKSYEWAIVGGGPAGIAAVGKLLDSGIKPEHILWVDPEFKVGDLGQYWSNVSSNTKVKYFIDFLEAASSFSYKEISHKFALNELPPDETCLLNHIVEPLQWVSNQLGKKVIAVKTLIRSIRLSERTWILNTGSQIFKAHKVILATGSLPSTLEYPGIETVPFEIAIDINKLSGDVEKDKTYAVFGSSHSAMIIIRHLVELNVKQIINFYRSPCRYAVDMGDWILFDNTGLKGETAEWARTYINGVLPNNLVRYNVNKANIERFLPECDKAIYAVGFEKRNDLIIEEYENLEHNPHNGIIGPGLFGFGIAYPEAKTDPFGSVESQVGLWKFMVYLKKVMPLWFRYSI